MFSIFKAKATYWNVIFRDGKGIVKTAILRADDEIELLSRVERTFKHADVLDYTRA